LTETNQFDLKAPTGVPGLDDILRGGLPKNQLYLLQGSPGTGKTTLAMKFLLEGARRGEKVLYITFSETKLELEAVAWSHGWDLKDVQILEISALQNSGFSSGTMFHSSEMELSRTISVVLEKIIEVGAERVVFDSVSELRLLSDSLLKYRRQMLAFKEFFIGRKATVLFLDDLTSESGDVQVQSIVHGVLLLEKFRAGYGVERRQFHISKLRGVDFRAGTHDYIIDRGGLRIYPRLVAAEHSPDFETELWSSGISELDKLLGGGLDRGTSNLLLGPAGSGKSTLALHFAVAAAKAGKKVSLFSFEEGVHNIISRSEKLGLDLKKQIDSKKIILRKVDPAELTPGQFTALLRVTNDEERADMVVIDSLNGYIHAMPEEQFIILQLHELLSYLNSRGVITVMVLAQAGILGAMHTPLDLTYLADTVILTRFFEAFGHVKKAISVAKKRTGEHEKTLRELIIGKGGVSVGPVLEKFSGIFSGTPKFLGSPDEIAKYYE
jgi:circadian clock protein KaiC